MSLYLSTALDTVADSTVFLVDSSGSCVHVCDSGRSLQPTPGLYVKT